VHLPTSLNAVNIRHSEVQQDQVRLEFTESLDSGAAVFGFSAHRPSRANQRGSTRRVSLESSTIKTRSCINPPLEFLPGLPRLRTYPILRISRLRVTFSQSPRQQLFAGSTVSTIHSTGNFYTPTRRISVQGSTDSGRISLKIIEHCGPSACLYWVVRRMTWSSSS